MAHVEEPSSNRVMKENRIFLYVSADINLFPPPPPPKKKNSSGAHDA